MQAPTVDKLITTSEACEFLRVDRKQLKKLQRLTEHPLPYLRVGKRDRYDPEALRRWAAENARRARGR
jgi:hypothetical protein